MRNISKTLCLSGFLFVSLTVPALASTGEAEVQPHDPQATVLPVTRGEETTETAAVTSLDTSALREIIRKNQADDSQKNPRTSRSKKQRRKKHPKRFK